jgi:transcriptional regulator with XRE-family HTH domain
MESEETTMGQRIRSMLRRRGILHREAAETLGVSNQTIGNWVSDRNAPRNDQVTALARLLSVDRSWLLSGASGLDEQAVLTELRELRSAQLEVLSVVLEIRRLLK